MVDRFALGQQGPDRRHPRLVLQPVHFLDRPLDIAAGHQDHAFEAAKIGLAIGRDVIVVRAIERLGQRDVGNAAHRRRPGSGDQEIDVPAFDVHVLDAVVDILILDADRGRHAMMTR